MARILKFQEGGYAPEGVPAEQAPEQGGQEQAMAQLQQIAQEIIQQLGPEGAMALAQMIVEMLQGAQAGAPQEQQFMRRGGKLCKKAACGTKVRK